MEDSNMIGLNQHYPLNLLLALDFKKQKISRKWIFNVYFDTFWNMKSDQVDFVGYLGKLRFLVWTLPCFFSHGRYCKGRKF